MAVQIDLAQLQRLSEHLLPGNDFTLAVLKGHLLVEEQLEHVLLAHSKVPGLIEKSQINFAVKLVFARALTGVEELTVVWEGCKHLNSLRNALAHNLEHPETQKRLNRFLATFRGYDPDWVYSGDALTDFRRGVIFLYGAVQGITQPVGMPCMRPAV